MVSLPGDRERPPPAPKKIVSILALTTYVYNSANTRIIRYLCHETEHSPSYTKKEKKRKEKLVSFFFSIFLRMAYQTPG